MNKKPILSLFTVILFDHTSINIIFPLLTIVFFDAASSLFAPDTSTAVRSMWYGVAASLSHIGGLIAAPLLSLLSDRWGRRPILLIAAIGAFLMAVSGALSLFLGSVLLILLGRLIGGLCSRTHPIAQAAIGDLCPPAHKMTYIGYLQTTIAISALLGPLLAGYMAKHWYTLQFNYALPFVAAAVIALISIIVTWRRLPESLERQSRSKLNWQAVKTYKKIIFTKPILQISLLLALCQFSWSMYYQFISPLIKQSFNFSATEIGTFVGVIALWLALSASLGLQLLKKFLNTRYLLISSIGILLMGLLLTAAVTFMPAFIAQPVLWLAALPIAMGDVIAYSAIITLYSNYVNASNQGLIMGFSFIIVSLLWSITGLLGGILAAINISLPLLCAPLGTIFILVLIYFKPDLLEL